MNENVIDETVNNTGAIYEPLPMSKELENLLFFMNDVLSKELPTLTIDLDYFILSIFSQKESNIFRRLNDCLMSSAIDAIYNAFYKTVSSKALSAIKSNRKVSLDNILTDTLMKGETEARNMGSNMVTSEHIFLAILSDPDKDNKIKKCDKRSCRTENRKLRLSPNKFQAK